MHIDVLVHGGDFAAALISYLLSRHGYSVVLATKAPRLSEECLYLPFTSAWLRYLNELGLPKSYFTRLEKIQLALDDAPHAQLTPLIGVCVGDMRSLAEWTASQNDLELSLWCRDLSWKIVSREVAWRLRPRGGVVAEGKASLVIDTERVRDRVGDVVLLTTHTRDDHPSILRLGQGGLTLAVRHGRLTTHLFLGEPEERAGISLTRVPLCANPNFGEVPLLLAGIPCSFMTPPWLGDYLAASAILGVMIAVARLSSGDVDERVLQYVAELRAQSRLSLKLIKEFAAGMQAGLTVRQVEEAISPPTPPISYRL